MRIEAYNQIQQLYQTKKVTKVQQQSKVGPTDRLQISSLGRDIQTAKAAVAATPDIREDLTAAIKTQVESGTYAVDTASFAEKLLQKYEEMR